MAQDIAVRLASEGVPLRAIARAVQEPSAAVRMRLEQARTAGYLLELPRDDWPVRYPRDSALRWFQHLLATDRGELQRRLRITFGLPPALAEVLLLLLQLREVSHDYLGCSQTLLSVQIHRLRRLLREHAIAVGTLHGNGYYMSAADRQRLLAIALKGK